MSLWAPAFITAATGAMVALPLAPALIELHRRRDASPLVTRTDDGRIENFASSLREYMQPLTQLPPESHGKLLHNLLRDGSSAIVLSQTDVANLPDAAIDAAAYAPHSILFPAPVCFLRDLYIRGDLKLADESVLRAALVEGNAEFGERSSVMRWLHVEGNLDAAAEARFFGRTSCTGVVTISPGCQFERLRGKAIHFGTQQWPSSRRSSEWLAPGNTQPRLGRVRSQGDFHLGNSDAFNGHIVAAGSVTIADDVLVVGSVKAKANVEIGARSHVAGTVVSQGRTTIGDQCFLKGPVLSEGEIIVGPGTEIGSPDSPTTVSAPRVRIAAGAKVYGVAWARESGEVIP